jgi:hypothetical protein
MQAGRTDVINFATGLFQPIAADDVEALVADAALTAPRNGTRRDRRTREGALRRNHQNLPCG